MHHLPGRLLQVFFIIALAACGSSKHASTTKLPGTWQAQPIAVDGDSKDWPSPYPSYDAKAKVGYAMSNDKDNLYITMETGDAMTQIKMLRSGMTVWIDTGGGKNQAMAINYPLAAENADIQMDRKQEGDVQQNNPESMDREKRMQMRARRALDGALQLSLEGFGACNGGFLVKQTNNCGIVVRLAMDEYNEMIWEASIPLKALYGKDQLNKKDDGRPISVCFNIKAIKKPEKPKGDSGGMNEGGSGTGMHGGGMHGGGGGGMRGGGHGASTEASGGERTSMFESTKTWKQFGLAYKD